MCYFDLPQKEITTPSENNENKWAHLASLTNNILTVGTSSYRLKSIMVNPTYDEVIADASAYNMTNHVISMNTFTCAILTDGSGVYQQTFTTEASPTTEALESASIPTTDPPAPTDLLTTTVQVQETSASQNIAIYALITIATFIALA
jgi:hypothetical protein